jgi:hypothetical protein
MSTYKDPAVVLGFVAGESLDLSGSLYATLAGASAAIAAFVASEPNPKRRMVLNTIANDIQANLEIWGNQLASLAMAVQCAVEDVAIDEAARRYAEKAAHAAGEER